MSKWIELLSGTIPPGVYRLPSGAHLDTVQHTVEPEGWRVFVLDGEQITDKASLFQVAFEAMRLPRYFGRNWDAFEEMIRDLDWAPATGYVILFPHAAKFVRSRDWDTARSIFQNAVAYWKEQDKPMYVLVGGAQDLPKLDI